MRFAIAPSLLRRDPIKTRSPGTRRPSTLPRSRKLHLGRSNATRRHVNDLLYRLWRRVGGHHGHGVLPRLQVALDPRRTNELLCSLRVDGDIHGNRRSFVDDSELYRALLSRPFALPLYLSHSRSLSTRISFFGLIPILSRRVMAPAPPSRD
jgi:hypothetical protein